MDLEGYSERLVDVVDVVDDLFYVPVSGLFALHDLDLTLASIGEVFNKLPLCVDSVSDRTD